MYILKNIYIYLFPNSFQLNINYLNNKIINKRIQPPKFYIPKINICYLFLFRKI
jgi:hypothetical protein